MGCLSDLPELSILSAGSWGFEPIVRGFIPLLWTTGSYDPALQGSNPWFGLVTPNRFDWHGATAEIRYFSGGVQYNGCYVTFPPVQVKISFHCTAGFHQLHIIVIAGSRRFERTLWNVPGSWIIRNSLLQHDQSPFCSDKFLKGGNIKEMNFLSMVKWMELMRNNATQSSGIQPLWFEQAITLPPSGGLVDVCEGCYYGTLPRPLPLDTRTLDTISAGLPRLVFPVKESSLPASFSSCPGSLLVLAKDLTYTVYREIKLNCSEEILISGGGLIKLSCLAPDKAPLPEDNDPRWVPRCQEFSSCSELYYVAASAERGNVMNISKEGTYTSFTATPPVIPIEQVPASIAGGFVNGFAYEYKRRILYRISDVRTVMYSAETSSCLFRLERVVEWVEDNYEYVALNATITPMVRAYVAERDRLNLTGVCGQIPNVGYTPPPVNLPKKEDNEEGNCFVSGNFEIRVFSKAISTKITVNNTNYNVSVGFGLKVSVPFKFRVPSSGVNTSLGFTTSIVGTMLTIGTFAGPIQFDINQLAIPAEFILDVLIPRPFGVGKLKVFCE